MKPEFEVTGEFQEVGSEVLHAVPNFEKMELRDNHQLGGKERDAAQDYPESGAEATVVRVRPGTALLAIEFQVPGRPVTA